MDSSSFLRFRPVQPQFLADQFLNRNYQCPITTSRRGLLWMNIDCNVNVNLPTSVGTSHATLFSNCVFEQTTESKHVLNLYSGRLLAFYYRSVVLSVVKGEAGRIQVFRHLPNLFLVSFHVNAIKMLGLKIRFTYGPYSSKILERQWIMVELSENTHLTGL